jgi:DNA topoisomerase-3
MPPAVIDQVERTTVVAGQTFMSGPEEIIRQPGWQQAHDNEINTRAPKTQKLKPISSQSAVTLIDCAIVEEATKPPHRIREAELLSLMEHAGRHVDDPEMARILRKAGGIGTAATRAEIIENLKQKDYVFANLQPTVKGMHLIRVLKLARAENLTSTLLTAQLEQHLNQVESSASSRSSFISQTAKSVESSLQSMMQFDLERTFDFAPPLGDCPRCAKGQSEASARTVHERMWNYSCISNKDGHHPCGFVLPKDCDGRWLDPRTVSKLLTDHALEQGMTIDGFPADEKNRSSSRRRLKIANGSLEVLSETGQPMDAALHVNHSKSSARRRVTWGPCPIHHNDVCLIVETKNAFICETKLRHLREGNLSAVGFQLPKAICDQRLKFDDIQAFIRDGKTRLIEGFKSKGGKLFDAAVVRNPAGSWDFEFRGR